MSSFTLADAERAKARVESNGDDYGPSPQQSVSPVPSGDSDNTEPADPKNIDHNTRRQTRIVHPHTELSTIPKPLVECGCSECPDRFDPLGDDSDEQAIDHCPEPQPVTVGRAARIYYAYQSSHIDGSNTSPLDRVEKQYALAMEAEREIFDEWDGEVTTALLSLRIPPIESIESDKQGGGDESNGDNNGLSLQHTQPVAPSGDSNRRQWVPPTQLVNRLKDAWNGVRRALNRCFSDYDSRYLWVVAPTESAATPHKHIYVWVRDPDDETTVDHFRPVVQKFVEDTPTARAEHHPIGEGESDAVVIQHEPEMCNDVSEDQISKIYHNRGEEGFKLNTRGLTYILTQRPEWALRRVYSEESTFEDEQITLEGAATAWTSSKKWIGSCQYISLSTD